ncbi:MAG: Re/Si-specific NAD(P)(+) transhydrogenase subunit alpha [Cumulibacter sp.]
MRIGVLKESGDALVAATAATSAQLINLGYHVTVQHGAGSAAAQPDEAYVAAGAELGGADEVLRSDIVLKVGAPTEAEIAQLSPGTMVIAQLAPARSPELVSSLQSRGVTALAMDAVPRISRAQSMDVLSSLANVAGYRAVVEAAGEYGRQFGGQVTAAGKTAPARVFVVGAGVAGLAAIGTAGSLGAIVRAFDVRAEVSEQIESMGAQFVTVDMPQQISEDGYASEMSAEQEAATAAMYDEEARAADIVITTALIPGRPAPKLISADTIAAMRPGSVIVDLAAAQGGNCEGTLAGERVVTDSGVTILGYTDLPARLAAQSSQLYGSNVVNLLTLMTPAKDGVACLDLDDVILRGITVTHEGSLLWPPPPVQVSAAPAARAPQPEPVREPPRNPRMRIYAGGLVAVLIALVASVGPPSLIGHLTVFALAVVVGYYVISNVTHALHTPLMSETNAISGIILLGGLLQVGSDNTLVTVIALLAVLVASINIVGGFLVTSRMLKMFRKD